MGNNYYNASISVIGVKDTIAQNALKKLLENSQYLKAELERTKADYEAKIARLQSDLTAKLKG